jgi:hypothetical protein
VVGRNGWQTVGAIMLVAAACGGSTQLASSQTPPGPPTVDAAGRSGGPGRACATPDDSTGSSISGTFRARPEPLYAAGAAALRGLGYAVLENLPPRELITAPSYSWPAGTESEPWHGSEHPGVELFLFTRAAGDSTTVTIGARALCRVAGASRGERNSEVGRNLEGVVTLTAMNALINRLRGTPPS